MFLLLQDIRRPLLLQYEPAFYFSVENKYDQLMDCSSTNQNVVDNNVINQIEINCGIHQTQDVNCIEYSTSESNYADDVVEVCRELVDNVVKKDASFEADIKPNEIVSVYTACVKIVENLICSCVELTDSKVVPVSPHLESASQVVENLIIQEDNQTNIVITPPDISINPSNEEQCSNTEGQGTSHDEFESIWNKRKREVEIEAETAACGVFRQWKRDRVTLEQAINSSLKEYNEMYEKAHSLRLLFEEEKGKWAMQVAESYRKDEFNKRQCVDNNYVVNHGYGNNLHSEFQYTTDEEDQSDHQYTTTGPGITGTTAAAQAQNMLITPQKKVKKFAVPLKT